MDAQEIVYATIDNGLITLVTTTMEGHSNYKTIEDLQANLDRDTFWRVHRSYLVNINRIKEVVPWFKSSFQLAHGRQEADRDSGQPRANQAAARVAEALTLLAMKGVVERPIKINMPDGVSTGFLYRSDSEAPLVFFS